MLSLIHKETEPQNIRHIDIARRVLAPAEDRHGYTLPTSQPAPGRDSRDAAVQDAPPALSVCGPARASWRRLRAEVAGPAALTDRTYTITEADLENIERAKRDLGDLIVSLNAQDPDGFAEGCRLMARLDRVIRRAEAREQPAGDAA